MLSATIHNVTLAAAVLGLAVAAGSSYNLVVNNQVSSENAIVVSGKTYVPITVLKSLGVTSSLKGTTLTLSNSSISSAAQGVTAGGANQRASLEGCIGETLFNGVWRLTVKSVTPITRFGNQPGYSLSLEWKNGSKVTVDALNTGIKSLDLALEDGTVLQTEDAQSLTYKKLLQGAGASLELKFYAGSAMSADQLSKPGKFLVEIDPKVLANSSISAGAAYSTPNPSFRVALDCKK